MSRTSVELDFFPVHNGSSSSHSDDKLLHRRRSFRDIQSVVSKINPQLLRSVIASGSGNGVVFGKSVSVPTSPNSSQLSFPALPLHSNNITSTDQGPPGAAPLTIFYNGCVSVFHVSPQQAESVLKHAEGGSLKNAESTDFKPAVPPYHQPKVLNSLNGDLPHARRKSLQRFLEKRKERPSLASPYGRPTEKS